jgi:hypothetical protein
VLSNCSNTVADGVFSGPQHPLKEKWREMSHRKRKIPQRCAFELVIETPGQQGGALCVGGMPVDVVQES